MIFLLFHYQLGRGISFSEINLSLKDITGVNAKIVDKFGRNGGIKKIGLRPGKI